MSQGIELYEIVRLKGNEKHNLVVTEIDNDQITCIWIGNGMFQRATIPSAALNSVPDKTPPEQRPTAGALQRGQ